MISDKKILSLLSISAKAGAVVSGGFMTERSIQDNSACLVIVSKDASDNTRKKFENKSLYYKIPFKVFSDADTLGRQIGKQARTSIAITDPGLAKQIMKQFDMSLDMEV